MVREQSSCHISTAPESSVTEVDVIENLEKTARAYKSLIRYMGSSASTNVRTITLDQDKDYFRLVFKFLLLISTRVTTMF